MRTDANDQPKPMRWRDALVLLVRQETKGSVVTDYSLARLLIRLGADPVVQGREVKLPRNALTLAFYRRARAALLEHGLLLTDPLLPESVLLVPSPQPPDAGLLMSQLDPFGCTAYESAMVHHGLTNRLPRVLLWKSLPLPEWRLAAAKKMQQELGEQHEAYQRQRLPTLRTADVERWGGTAIQVVRNAQAGSGWRWVGETGVRVTTLGRTYLDMLQRPELCGGMRHVIEIFESTAGSHVELIVAEVDRNGTKLDQARVGYLLEARCGRSHPLLDSWAAQVTRGGSRRLDPGEAYSPTFSERWCLSIND